MNQIKNISQHLIRPRQLVTLFLLAITMATQAGDLVVAQVAPFTGGIAVCSNEIKVGATALFDAINATGGINSSKIRLITRDDKMDPQTTVAQFEEVARTERPIAFLFPVGPQSIAGLLQGGIPQKLGVPIIGTVPALYKLCSPVNPFVFHMGMGDDVELVKIVQHVATLGIRSIGVVYWNEPSALDAVALIEREARSRGLNVVMKSPVEAGTDKVAPALATIIGQYQLSIAALYQFTCTGDSTLLPKPCGASTTT